MYILFSLLITNYNNIIDFYCNLLLSLQEPGHTYNACDRGFGDLEGKYKEFGNIHSPDDFKTIIAPMGNAKHKYLAGHQILDLKKLTDEGNQSF